MSRLPPSQGAAAAQAEFDVAGVAAASVVGAKMARGRVEPTDFLNPSCGRVLRVALHPNVVLAEELAPLGDKEAARLAAIARKAPVDLSWLTHIVHDRRTMADREGVFAGQVRLDSIRRQTWDIAERMAAAARAGDFDQSRQLADAAARLQAEATRLIGGDLDHDRIGADDLAA